MDLNPRLVLLLKATSEGPETSYDKGFSGLDLDPISLSPIAFEWINFPTLLTKLCEPQSFSGMVLTSQRSVQAVIECLRYGHHETELILEPWRQKKIFVVGPATCAAAENLLGMMSSGKDSGNSEALALVILNYFKNHPDKHRSLLFPCSSLKQETLPRKLRDNGVNIECIECYKTKAHADLSQSFNHLIQSKIFKNNPEFHEFLPWYSLVNRLQTSYLTSGLLLLIKHKNKGVPAFFVFFSPSGVKSMLPVLRQKQIPLHELKLVSMGPSTSNCLASFGLTCAAEAPRPDSEGLIQVLRKLNAERS